MAGLKPFRERLDWRAEAGEIVDGEVRYILIRPDTLMGLFANLAQGPRADALAAFSRSTTEHGRKSAERYRALGAAAADQLIATIEATAPQLGWGLWRISREAYGNLALTVENSPFAAGYGRSQDPVCAPIAGMFAAVAVLVEGTPMTAAEHACAAAGAARCAFRTRPGDAAG